MTVLELEAQLFKLQLLIYSIRGVEAFGVFNRLVGYLLCHLQVSSALSCSVASWSLACRTASSVL
jgi:hypothetical protein